MTGINAWLLPVAIMAIGFVNWLQARALLATWLLRSAWAMMAGGLTLLIGAAFRELGRICAYLALVMLVVAAVCLIVGLVRRENRIKTD